ncbi:MAG TPA: PKD domain-containing protein, partial [Longimicrobium sp.]|nr:PKD domain-containing protein [Longimicrobium sp.]
LRCAAPDPSAGTASGAIIGGQGTNVLLTGTNLAYDPAAGEFRLDATIRNLMAGRTLGTYDGSGVAGIRLFFHSGPTAVEGEGEVGIINTDGSDLFLAWGEPFFTYASMLGPDQETEPRRWRFSVPPGVARFRFGVYLEAPVWDGATRTDVLGAFTQVTAGFSHSCGLTDDRRIFCWGDGADGRLGHGGTSLFLDPVEVDAGNREWRLVSAGKEHTCGVTTEDEGVCWGKGSGVSTGDMVVDSLDAGGTATCATAAGTTYCWGTNEWGQLGMGDTLPRRKPEPVAGGHTFVTVRVGTNHTCALTAEGEAWCWGMNARGQLGAASAQSCGPHFPYPCSTTPVRVDTELRFARIDAGAGHTCALTAEGEAYCWGENVFGQVGDGSTDDVVPRPAAVVTEMRFAQVAAMDRNSCGIQADGVADCWGANPSSVTQSVDDVVAGERWRSIAGMDVHMCLAAADGQGYCSGREQFGELGNLGTHQNTANPRAALAPLHVFDLPPRAGFDHSGDGSADVVFNAREDHFHRFFATYSDDDFGIEQRLWSFGDGTTGKGNWIRHVYTANGTYTVTLTVVDAAGQRAMTQRTVWVTSLP